MGLLLISRCLALLLVTRASSFAIRDAVGEETILHFLEGNSTDVPFDDDGTDFDIFSTLFAASSKGYKLEEQIPGDFTVFAPDDNAFRRAVADLGLNTDSELKTYENFLIYLMGAYRYPFDFLTRILYYHVVPGEYSHTEALQMPSIMTWDAPSRITRQGYALIDRNPLLPNSKFDVDRVDIQASNGIVHVIDYVLFPEQLRTIALNENATECGTPEPSLEDFYAESTIGPFTGNGEMEAAPTAGIYSETPQPSAAQDEFLTFTAIPSSTLPNNSPETQDSTASPTSHPTDTNEEQILSSQESDAQTPELTNSQDMGSHSPQPSTAMPKPSDSTSSFDAAYISMEPEMPEQSSSETDEPETKETVSEYPISSSIIPEISLGSQQDDAGELPFTSREPYTESSSEIRVDAPIDSPEASSPAGSLPTTAFSPSADVSNLPLPSCGDSSHVPGV